MLQSVINQLQSNDSSFTVLDFRNVSGSVGSTSVVANNEKVDQLLQALRNNKTIETVNITIHFFRLLTDQQKIDLMDAIGAVDTLKSLQIGSSGFSGAPLLATTQALRQAKHLVSLRLHSIHFRETVYYRRTESGDMNTHDEDFVAFCQVLRTLDSLHSFALDDAESSIDLDSVVSALSELPRLKEVYFKCFTYPEVPCLSRESLQCLCRSPTVGVLTLKRLNLSSLVPDFLIELERNPVMTSLSLECNQLTMESGFAIAHLIEANSSLSYLNLGYNLLPDECGVLIAMSLLGNTVLKHLDMSANGLRGRTCTALASVLGNDNIQAGSALEYLSLAQNQLGDEGCKTIATGLANNTRLQVLTLAETNIQDDGCLELANVLAENRVSLTRLNLSDNKVTNVGCLALAEALRNNTKLKSLSLFNNRIGNVGVAGLANVLQATNRTLEQLNLAGNQQIDGSSPFEALEQMLAENMVLRELWTPRIPYDSNIPTYLKLNQVGRRHLFQHTSFIEEWVDALAVCSDNLACLYYLLRGNPTICETEVGKIGINSRAGR